MYMGHSKIQRCPYFRGISFKRGSTVLCMGKHFCKTVPDLPSVFTVASHQSRLPAKMSVLPGVLKRGLAEPLSNRGVCVLVIQTDWIYVMVMSGAHNATNCDFLFGTSLIMRFLICVYPLLLTIDI